MSFVILCNPFLSEVKDDPSMIV